MSKERIAVSTLTRQVDLKVFLEGDMRGGNLCGGCDCADLPCWLALRGGTWRTTCLSVSSGWLFDNTLPVSRPHLSPHSLVAYCGANNRGLE